MFGQFEKALVIINSLAPKRNNKEIIDLLYKYYEKDIERKDLVIKSTVDENSTRIYARDFVKDYPKSLIVSAGGDGTIFEIVNEIALTDSSLIPLANGTGNDFCRTLYGDEIAFDQIISSLKDLRIEKVDLIKINDEYSVNAVSFGYDSIVLEKAIAIKEKYPLLRRASFSLGVLLTLKEISAYKYEYEFYSRDGKLESGSGSFLISVLSNGKHFGKGFTPAPNARIDDGLINLNRVAKAPITKLISLMPTYRTGDHTKYDISLNHEVVSGQFTPIGDQVLLGNIDGEIRYFKEINFEIKEKALNLALI